MKGLQKNRTTKGKLLLLTFPAGAKKQKKVLAGEANGLSLPGEQPGGLVPLARKDRLTDI